MKSLTFIFLLVSSPAYAARDCEKAKSEYEKAIGELTKSIVERNMSVDNFFTVYRQLSDLIRNKKDKKLQDRLQIKLSEMETKWNEAISKNLKALEEMKKASAKKDQVCNFN